jgi:hypothetical protein
MVDSLTDPAGRRCTTCYIAAFAPDRGESVNTLIADPPPGAPVPPILPPRDGFLFLDREKFAVAAGDGYDPTATLASNLGPDNIIDILSDNPDDASQSLLAPHRFTGRRDVRPETIRAVAGLASDRAAAR